MPKKTEMNMKKTELEFVTEVAEDCILHLKEKDKAYLINNPYSIDYHFSYCLYIRNHYIHNRYFSDEDYWTEPDHLSSEIIKMIFDMLLPEYEYENSFVRELYDNPRFIKLRQVYKAMYDEYPVDLVEKYKLTANLKTYKQLQSKIEKLLKELSEKVWRVDDIRKITEECGIEFEPLIPRIDEIQKILFDENEFIPIETCLLPYRKEIGRQRYIKYRRRLSKVLNEHPGVMKKLDPLYFNDRVLAKSVLKYGWTLGLLPQYQDDEVMVRYSLSHDGGAIQYTSKRFQTNREWVKYAIEHSAAGTIMFLDCMKPYRKDKELVYLACKVARGNFVYVDKSFRDDLELAKICMEQIGEPNDIYSYMSTRLRGNKELAMLDLQEEFPNIEYYSAKLRNDDDIAAELYRLHGNDAWHWYYMSKRLKKKYNIEESL